MKKLVLFAAVLMVSLFSIDDAKAQIHLNVNISQQPVWGPTGYDHVDYYYLPDINAYYNVTSKKYIYSNQGNLVWTNSLPAQFRNFDLYRAYKVVVNEPKPYLRNNVYVAKYSRFKNYNGRQLVIRDSRDSKYDVVKNHPNYKAVAVSNNCNRQNRTQKTVVKINQNSRTAQNANRGNDRRIENDRPDRNKANGRSK